MKKPLLLILAIILALFFLTACEIITDTLSDLVSNGVDDTKDDENDVIYRESDFDIDELFDEIADMFPDSINGNLSGLSTGSGMAEIYGMPGIKREVTPVPFTPKRVAGLDLEWPWAVVEIGWNGYGDGSRWVRYADLFDDGDEYLYEEETPPPTTEPPPPKERDDSAYYDEPDKTMPIITSSGTWPAAYLPPGTPVYPDGELEVSGSAGNVFITAYNSSVESLVAYLETLENAGWGFYEYGDPETIVMGVKGMWFIQCGCYDGSTVVMQISYDDWNT